MKQNKKKKWSWLTKTADVLLCNNLEPCSFHFTDDICLAVNGWGIKGKKYVKSHTHMYRQEGAKPKRYFIAPGWATSLLRWMAWICMSIYVPRRKMCMHTYIEIYSEFRWIEMPFWIEEIKINIYKKKIYF